MKRRTLLSAMAASVGLALAGAPSLIGRVSAAEPVAILANANPAMLTAEEAAGLRFMREEEKLARDVYTVLYNRWRLPVFSNITRSEQAHMDAMLTLLNRYGLEDPAAGTATGEFVNEELQALYDQLVEQGSRSPAEALLVGGAIEEIDIIDLRERIAQTDRSDIKRVYENLMSGSYNHLRSFSANYESQTGEAYSPQYLSQAEYESIVSAASQTGRRGR